MQLKGLQTPALIVDKKIFEKNMQTMKDLVAGTGIALRPHFKSHKSVAIAHMQIASGAKGMTCAKLSEAEDLADAGIEDVLIANQVVEPQKIARLAYLANHCHLTVCVDNEKNIEDLDKAAALAGSTVHTYIEFEIGMQRCGISDPCEVVRLAKLISQKSNLDFAGIQAYAGHISHMTDQTRRNDLTAQNHEKLRSLLALLKENGVPAREVSGASTGTVQIKVQEGLYTELQAGSYLLMDAVYAQLGLPFENSLFILTTVVSKQGNITVVDAGVKTCGVDQGMPKVVGATTEKIVDSEEHFQLHGLSADVKVGDKLLLIPGHCCSTVNLHDRIYMVRDGKVTDRIQITARFCGK